MTETPDTSAAPETAPETTVETPAAPHVPSSKQTALQTERQIENLRQQQSFGAALSAGTAAALAGAALWGAVTVVTHYELGLTAIVVGVMVGLAVRKAGRGIEKKFGVLAAVLALIGSVAGKLLSVNVAIAQHYGTPIPQALMHMDLQRSIDLLTRTYRPMDLLFYAIAVYEAYKYGYGRLVVRKKKV